MSGAVGLPSNLRLPRPGSGLLCLGTQLEVGRSLINIRYFRDNVPNRIKIKPPPHTKGQKNSDIDVNMIN